MKMAMADDSPRQVAVSIVSHGHGDMVGRLVESLLRFPEIGQVLVTKNIPETLCLAQDERISVIENSLPKGFGANHNAAFSHCKLDFFCPLNPDIALTLNPFSELLDSLESTGAALVAPLVKSPAGGIEDSIRRFPGFLSVLGKFFGGKGGSYLVQEDQGVFFPEWVAGMFMLFRSSDFSRLGGFDPGYFLYYEDVDICVRTWLCGRRIVVCPRASVIHDARRASHRNLRHLRWHVSSMVRYFLKYWGRLPTVAGQN